MVSALMVPVVDDNFPEKNSAIGKNKVHKPTFKGVWYVAVNFALLSLRDTRPDQYPLLTPEEAATLRAILEQNLQALEALEEAFQKRAACAAQLDSLPR